MAALRTSWARAEDEGRRCRARVEEEGSSELDAALRTVLGSGRGRGVAALAAAALLGSRRRRHSAGDKGARLLTVLKYQI